MRPTLWAGWGQEALQKGWEGSGGPSTGPGEG